MADIVYMAKSAWTALLDAIRTKGGTSALMTAAQAKAAVEAIPTGGGDTIIPQITIIAKDGLKGATLPEICFFGELLTLGDYALQRSTGKKIIVMPKLTSLGTQVLPEDPPTATLETLDLGGTVSGTGAWQMSGCAKLSTIILRKSSVVALSNTNALNATPFANNGAASGGVLYVPETLVASYQGASNWSTILGYTKNQIKSIESTHTDPNAPIDLTLFYADGTPITN